MVQRVNDETHFRKVIFVLTVNCAKTKLGTKNQLFEVVTREWMLSLPIKPILLWPFRDVLSHKKCPELFEHFTTDSGDGHPPHHTAFRQAS